MPAKINLYNICKEHPNVNPDKLYHRECGRCIGVNICCDNYVPFHPEARDDFYKFQKKLIQQKA